MMDYSSTSLWCVGYELFVNIIFIQSFFHNAVMWISNIWYRFYMKSFLLFISSSSLYILSSINLLRISDCSRYIDIDILQSYSFAFNCRCLFKIRYCWVLAIYYYFFVWRRYLTTYLDYNANFLLGNLVLH
jgi:hypothetical protein